MNRFVILLSTFIVTTFLSGCLSSSIFTDTVDESSFTISKKEQQYYLDYQSLNNPYLAKKTQTFFGKINYNDLNTDEKLIKLKEINWKIKSKFINIDEEIDHWDNGIENIIDNKIYRGDCEDLVLTSLYAAYHAGFPKERLYKIVTKIDGSDIPNHMVAGYKDEEGFMWIFGDTTNTHVDIFIKLKNKHKPYAYSRMTWDYNWIIIENNLIAKYL